MPNLDDQQKLSELTKTLLEVADELKSDNPDVDMAYIANHT